MMDDQEAEKMRESNATPEISPDRPASEPRAVQDVDSRVGPADTAHVVLPTATSSILRLTDRRLAGIAALIGIAGGIGISAIAYLIAPPRSPVGQMFDLTRVSGAIPVTIACMLCWGIVTCALRWLRVSAVARLSRHSLVVNACQVLSVVGPGALARQLDVADADVSPVLRRLQALLRQWSFKRSLQDADLVLQQHDAHDQEAVHSGYQMLRVFVWAMPVLGLIGTVIGISAAVGGFAAFLSGNVDDVAVIKESLVGVTSGLSFAFLITMEGLLGALVLMLPVTALQSHEERVHARVHHDIVETFLPVLQRVAPPVAREQIEPVRIDIEKVVDVAREAFDNATRFWQERMASLADGVLARVSLASEKLAAEGARTITQTAQSTAADLNRSAAQSAAQFQEVTRQQQALADQHTQLLEAQARLETAVATTRAAAEQRSRFLLDETIARFAEAGESVGQQFRSMHEHEVALLRTVINEFQSQTAILRVTLDAHQVGFREAVETWTREGPRVDAYFTALRELGGDLQRLGDLQEKVYVDLRELNANGMLIDALRAVNGAVLKVEPFLQTLSGSFHFVAVPTASPTSGNGT